LLALKGPGALMIGMKIGKKGGAEGVL